MQDLPPLDGGGWEQVLVLCCDPPPHSLTQSDQSDQEDQQPSTDGAGVAKMPAKRLLIYTYHVGNIIITQLMSG